MLVNCKGQLVNKSAVSSYTTWICDTFLYVHIGSEFIGIVSQSLGRELVITLRTAVTWVKTNLKLRLYRLEHCCILLLEYHYLLLSLWEAG